MIPSAVISECGTYRYFLTRYASSDIGTQCNRRIAFVMLNPSTADATKDDPTIRKCAGFAYRIGYPAFDVVNLFAFRATDPRLLMGPPSRLVGPENDDWIRRTVDGADLVIAAWGAHAGRYLDREAEVRRMIAHRSPKCFGRTAGGFPRHPLMLPYSTMLEAFS